MGRYGADDYGSWVELLDDTLHARPWSKPLDITIWPPGSRRDTYLGMTIRRVGHTDTRRYRWGRNRRQRSETYARRMIWDYIALQYDLPVWVVRESGPDLRFTWSDAPWENEEP